MNGYLRLHRKMLGWEWFKDSNTLHVFLFLLLNTSWTASKLRGVDVQPGQLITTVDLICNGTGLSSRSVRTCINRLKSTSEVTIKTTNKYSLVTIANWAFYQSDEEKTTSKTTSTSTNERQTNDKQTAHNKKSKKDNNIYSNSLLPESAKKQYGEFGNVLLTEEQYQQYCRQYGKTVMDSTIADVDVWFGNNTKIRDKRKEHILTVKTFLKKSGAQKLADAEPEQDKQEPGDCVIDIAQMLQERGLGKIDDFGR